MEQQSKLESASWWNNDFVYVCSDCEEVVRGIVRDLDSDVCCPKCSTKPTLKMVLSSISGVGESRAEDIIDELELEEIGDGEIMTYQSISGIGYETAESLSKYFTTKGEILIEPDI